MRISNGSIKLSLRSMSNNYKLNQDTILIRTPLMHEQIDIKNKFKDINNYMKRRKLEKDVRKIISHNAPKAGIRKNNKKR